MTNETKLVGGCLCGAVRYRVSAAPFAAEYCHCGMCRKSAGAPVVCWMDFRAEQLTWANGNPTEYASSEHSRRGFCPACGSTLTFRDARHPEYISLTIGSLDDPNLVEPTYHIYTDDQVGWLTIEDEHKRFAQEPKKPSA